MQDLESFNPVIPFNEQQKYIADEVLKLIIRAHHCMGEYIIPTFEVKCAHLRPYPWETVIVPYTEHTYISLWVNIFTNVFPCDGYQIIEIKSLSELGKSVKHH